MFVTLKTAARHAGTSLALLGLTSLAAMPAVAETSPKATPAAQAKPAAVSKAAASKTAAPATSIVVRDAETGQLRAATAEEAAALSAPAANESGKTRGGANSAITAQPQAKSHSSGAVGARMTDEFATYSVATKRADGSVDVEHVEGKKAANAAVKSAKVLPAPAQLPTK